MNWTTQNRFSLIFSFVLFSSSSSNRDDVSSLLCLIFCLITYVRWQSVPEVYRYDQHKYRASYNNGGTAVRFSPSTPKRLVTQASPLGCGYWLVITYVCMYIYMYIFVNMSICIFITRLLVCMTYIRMSIWTYFSICVYPCTIRCLSLVYAYSSVKASSPSTRFRLRDMIRLLASL